MPSLRLSKPVIGDLKPGTSDIVYWDAGLAGFGVKVTPKGRKVFVVMYRTRDGHSRLRKYTIGPYGQVTLAMARTAAQKILAARIEGRDPAGEKRALRHSVVTDSIEEVIAQYRVRHVAGTRSAKETIRILDREILPRWKGRSIHEIRRRDILTMTDDIVDRGSPGMANRVFTVARASFNWAIGRGLIESSPCAGLSKPSTDKARVRVLTDDELGAVLYAARRAVGPFGAVVEFLALTGQRRSEVTEMNWDEVDLQQRTWTIPSRRTKNGRPHMVHLASRAMELLPTRQVGQPLVFPTPSGQPFVSFSAAKRELDQASHVSGWVLHDLRRTMVSGMARLGVAPHVADKILNHQSGAISGVAAVYQRHDFLAERKAAIELWGDHVAGLLHPRPHRAPRDRRHCGQRPARRRASVQESSRRKLTTTAPRADAPEHLCPPAWQPRP